MFKILNPEVPGEIGENSIIDYSIHPPKVQKLHYVFDTWLGSDIVESFPCFLVTERLRKRIEDEILGGISFFDIEIATTERFKEFYPSRVLPTFYWMKVDGIAGKDDFGLSENYRLVLSPKVLETLSSFTLKEADFEIYKK